MPGHVVARRIPEFGVWLALGGGRSRVAGPAAGSRRYGIVLVAAGLALGVPLALAGGDPVRSFLPGLDPVDLRVAAAVVLWLIASGATASLGPVLSAVRADPRELLRAE